jgi:hypothetical protein
MLHCADDTLVEPMCELTPDTHPTWVTPSPATAQSASRYQCSCTPSFPAHTQSSHTCSQGSIVVAYSSWCEIKADRSERRLLCARSHVRP